VEPDRRRTLAIAGQALAALAADPTVSGDARDRYGRALSRFWALTGDTPGEPHPRRIGVGGRGEVYLAARQSVGQLLGLGVPWDAVYLVLADVVDGWSLEHATTCADRRTRAIGGPVALPLDHYLLYGVARTHLLALARTVPAVETADYWFVVQLLDSVHDPLCRPTADPPVTDDHVLHYATARAAITALCAFDLDNRVILSVRDVLDREWSRDTTTLLRGRA
jgi:hypothetical protein